MSYAGFRVDLDLATVALDGTLYECEPDARPGAFVGSGEPFEHLEDPSGVGRSILTPSSWSELLRAATARWWSGSPVSTASVG